MGLSYHTEYRLGRRGGRICRSYTGLKAFLAIAIDLLFVLSFDLAFWLLAVVLKMVLMTLTAVFYLLSLPFHLARRISARLTRRAALARERQFAMPHKPAWPVYEEV